MKLVIEIPEIAYKRLLEEQHLPNRIDLEYYIVHGTPLPKGHWIKSNIPNEKYVCSECGGACWYYDYQADVAKSRYCPNCGCRMIEPQESEDKE